MSCVEWADWSEDGQPGSASAGSEWMRHEKAAVTVAAAAVVEGRASNESEICVP